MADSSLLDESDDDAAGAPSSTEFGAAFLAQLVGCSAEQSRKLLQAAGGDINAALQLVLPDDSHARVAQKRSRGAAGPSAPLPSGQDVMSAADIIRDHVVGGLSAALSKVDSVRNDAEEAARQEETAEAAAALLSCALDGPEVTPEEARAVLRTPEVQFDTSKLADVLERPSRDPRRAAVLRSIGIGAPPVAPAGCWACGDEKAVCSPLGLCGHASLCNEHVAVWLKMTLDSGALPPFLCPTNAFSHGSCPGVVSTAAVHRAVMPEAARTDDEGANARRTLELLVAAQERQRNTPELVDTHVLRCPAHSCGALVLPSSRDTSTFGGAPAKPNLACATCSLRFCRVCKCAPHFPLPCLLWLDFRGRAAALADKPRTFEPLTGRILEALGNAEPTPAALARAMQQAEIAAAADAAAAAAANRQRAAEEAGEPAPEPALPDVYSAPSMSAEEAAAATEALIARTTKTCPGCGSPIERMGGCNSVNCRTCHRSFCWSCGGAAHHHARGECGAGLTDAVIQQWSTYDPASELESSEHRSVELTRRQREAAEVARLERIHASNIADVRAWITDPALCDAALPPPSDELVDECLMLVQRANAQFVAATASNSAAAAAGSGADAVAATASARATTLLAFLHAHRFYEAAGLRLNTGLRMLPQEGAATLADFWQRVAMDEAELHRSMDALQTAMTAVDQEQGGNELTIARGAVANRVAQVITLRRRLEAELLRGAGDRSWLALQLREFRAWEEARKQHTK